MCAGKTKVVECKYINNKGKGIDAKHSSSWMCGGNNAQPQSRNAQITIAYIIIKYNNYI